MTDLALPHRGIRAPAYQWLYDSIREQILGGSLRPGVRLPGTRDLAQQYRLSRGTIVAAFDQLKSEGYVEGTVGSGTYVSKVLPEELLHARPPEKQRAETGRQKLSLSSYAQRITPFPAYEVKRTRA